MYATVALKFILLKHLLLGVEVFIPFKLWFLSFQEAKVGQTAGAAP